VGATRVFIAAIPPPLMSSGDDLAGTDMTLGLVDRIFRAASGVSIDLVIF